MKVRFFRNKKEVFSVLAFSKENAFTLADNHNVEFDSYMVIAI